MVYEGGFMRKKICEDKKLYMCWINMIRRCENPNYPTYYRYGALGRKVCEEWKSSYETFQTWAFANGYRPDLSLDRIDNEKGYSPENCRWADRYTQQNNTRRNIWVTLDGETHTIAQWLRIKGIPDKRWAVYSRIRKGMSIEEALTKPLRPRSKKQDKKEPKKQKGTVIMWLSPNDIQTHYSIKRSTAYQLLKEYEESGGEVIRIGKLRRVPEESFTKFLKERE